jgi:hypothetical protein
MDECRKSAIVDAMTRIPYDTLIPKRKSLTNKLQKIMSKRIIETPLKERTGSKEDGTLSAVNTSSEFVENKKPEFIELMVT